MSIQKILSILTLQSINALNDQQNILKSKRQSINGKTCTIFLDFSHSKRTDCCIVGSKTPVVGILAKLHLLTLE